MIRTLSLLLIVIFVAGEVALAQQEDVAKNKSGGTTHRTLHSGSDRRRPYIEQARVTTNALLYRPIMRTILFLVILAATIEIFGCKTNVGTPNPTAESKPTPAPATQCDAQSLQSQMEEHAKVTQGPVGVAATLIETGQTVTLNGDRRFAMQSVYKLPIAMAILTRVDNKSLTLDQKVEIKPKDYVSRREHTIALDYPKGANLSITELLDYMIAESDGTACDALLRLLGGPEAATKYVRELKINDITIATYEADMFADPSVASRNFSTPLAMIEVLRLLQSGNVLSANSRQLLLDLMIKSRPGPKRIKGLLPPEMQVAHKTGTSGTRDGVTATTNDVGLITLPNGQHLAIAVFVSESKANLPTREAVIAKIARAATDCWQ